MSKLPPVYEVHCYACGQGYGALPVEGVIVFCPHCLSRHAMLLQQAAQAKLDLASLPPPLDPPDPVIEGRRLAIQAQIDGLTPPVATPEQVAAKRQQNGPGTEYRLARCGMSGVKLGHVRVIHPGMMTPAVFANLEQLQAYEAAGLGDPKGDTLAIGK